MSRMIAFRCGPCQSDRRIAPCCVDLTARPSVVIDCPFCGSTVEVPVTLGQALNVRAQRIADVMLLDGWHDALEMVDTPADLGLIV